MALESAASDSSGIVEDLSLLGVGEEVRGVRGTVEELDMELEVELDLVEQGVLTGLEDAPGGM